MSMTKMTYVQGHPVSHVYTIPDFASQSREF